MSSNSNQDSRTYRLIKLVSELRDRGADSHAWRRHFVSNLDVIAHSELSIVFEVEGLNRDRITVIKTDDHRRMDDRAPPLDSSNYVSFLANPTRHSKFTNFVSQFHTSSLITVSGRKLADSMTLKSTQGSSTFETDFGLGPSLFSGCRLKTYRDRYLVLWLFRTLDSEDFTEHQARRVNLLMRYLSDAMGTALASADTPSPEALSKRRRDVLEGLLLGKSDAEIAELLGIAYNTVRCYTKEIYLYFGVQSRAELMSRWISYGRSV